jgi:hypothetical protein
MMLPRPPPLLPFATVSLLPSWSFEALALAGHWISVDDDHSYNSDCFQLGRHWFAANPAASALQLLPYWQPSSQTTGTDKTGQTSPDLTLDLTLSHPVLPPLPVLPSNPSPPLKPGLSPPPKPGLSPPPKSERRLERASSASLLEGASTGGPDSWPNILLMLRTKVNVSSATEFTED